MYSEINFDDHPEFKPNLSPKEIMQRGSFGGTYFRDIYSSVTGMNYSNVHQEFPSDWFENLDMDTQVCSQKYITKNNFYKVKCGSSLEEWESKDWISEIDPYGFVQWYFRFYQGRRCFDDERQIKRFNNFAGTKGRWRFNLCKKIVDKIHDINDIEEVEEKLNDFKIAPGVRQSLQHWGYILTMEDLLEYINK